MRHTTHSDDELLAKKALRRERKRRPRMKMSGRSVLTLKRIIIKRGKKQTRT